MNTKTKKALGILAAVGVATFAGVAAASSGKKSGAGLQRRPIGQNSGTPPEYDSRSPGWPSIVEGEPYGTHQGAALQQLEQVLQGQAPQVVDAVVNALKTNTSPVGVPDDVAEATAQAQDAASAGQPTQSQTGAVADLATQIQQATPAVQDAIAIASAAVAAGEPIPADVAQTAAGVLQGAAQSAANAGIELPPAVADAVNQAGAAQLPDPGMVNAPTTIADDTADLLALMLADEAQPNWKRKIPELASWQAARGLKADQMFGPKSAQTMAKETGLLPIVRYWPTGSYREGKWLKDYRAALLAEAASASEPRASQLKAAALREQGQAFAPVQPIKILIALE